MIAHPILLLSSIPLVLGHTHEHSYSQNDHGMLVTCVRFCQDFLFQFNARYNSLLATVVIQLLPCLIIYWIPGMRTLSSEHNMTGSMNLLVSFAMGTLLGDIFLHLVPEVFSSIDIHDHEVAHQQFMIMSAAICCGFMSFFVLEKTMSIVFLNADSEISFTNHSHSHEHSIEHVHDHQDGGQYGHELGGLDDTTLRQRKKNSTPRRQSAMEEKSPIVKSSSAVCVYLNIVSGFIHNVTDGIALASSFYSSKQVGVSTTIAIMFHEIPHQLGDFAILTSNGFTFAQAFKSQLVNSIGSLTGTAIGCALNEISAPLQTRWSLWPQLSLFTATLPSLRLPLTTGGFLYLVTMGVVRQMLSTTTKDQAKEFKIWLLQLIFIFIGFALMASLAVSE